MDRKTDGEMNTLTAHGLEELFFSCAVGSVFWFWREIGFGVTYLCTLSTIQLWHCVSFWFWREIVFGVTYVLNPNFLLLRISFLYCIDLHPYNHYRFSKKSRPFCASRNWWIIVVFLQCNSLTITIVSQKYWDLLQSYSNDWFSKKIKNFLFR